MTSSSAADERAELRIGDRLVCQGCGHGKAVDPEIICAALNYPQTSVVDSLVAFNVNLARFRCSQCGTRSPLRLPGDAQSGLNPESDAADDYFVLDNDEPELSSEEENNESEGYANEDCDREINSATHVSSDINWSDDDRGDRPSEYDEDNAGDHLEDAVADLVDLHEALEESRQESYALEEEDFADSDEMPLPEER